MSYIPESLAELTSEWLTDALRSSGHIGRETVTVKNIEKIGGEFGFASQIRRIRLSFDPPTSRLPSTMIAKLQVDSSDASRVPLLEDKYTREAAFYSNVWPDVGCRTPACYYVAHEPEPPRFITLDRRPGYGPIRRRSRRLVVVRCRARCRGSGTAPDWMNGPGFDGSEMRKPSSISS